jgi:hypothetical protein
MVSGRLRALILAVFALMPSAYLAWTWRDMPQLGISHDDSVYLVSARSLAQGDGYRIESLPGQPFQTKYPPLFPLLLSAVWRLNPSFPGNLPIAALTAWLLLIPSLLAMRASFRNFGLGTGPSWLLTFVAAVNPWICLFSTTLMSDLLFLALFLGSMWLAEKALDSGASWWWAAAAGLLAGSAYLTRTVALPIVFTAPFCFFWRRQIRRALLFLSTTLPAVVGWQTWTWTHKLPTSDPVLTYYTDYMAWQRATVHLDNIVTVVAVNLDHFLHGLGQLILFDISVWENRTIECLIAIAALVGTVRMVRHSGRLQYPAAAAGMTAVLLVYHYPPDARLCLPLLPLVWMGLWAESSRLSNAIVTAWRKRRVSDRVAAAVCSLVLAAAALFLITAYIAGNAILLPRMYAQHRAELDLKHPSYRWFHANTPAHATSYAYDDALFYLYTGRRSLGLTVPYGRAYGSEPERVADTFAAAVPRTARSHGLEYLFLTRTDFSREGSNRARLARAAAEKDPHFHQVHADTLAAIYRMTEPAAP